MYLPNIITFGRLILVPMTVYAILVGEFDWAVAFFIIAGVSDAVDGILARLLNAQTALGGHLDPLADKALLVSVYLSLAQTGNLPLWLVILVVSRDIMIIGGILLLYTLRLGPKMQPLTISKINTVAQIALAALVLALLSAAQPAPLVLGWSLIAWLQGAVAATTLLSGAAYVLQYRALFTTHGDLP
ncbi:MAG: CDP-alcohol phosphatidyltransferase family protein [Azospirillum sp.]|nr:CDP-alcohol phosphatidyltransferase family protein [Azospirillum sp.]